jgi:hypothetical protein
MARIDSCMGSMEPASKMQELVERFAYSGDWGFTYHIVRIITSTLEQSTTSYSG